MKYVREDLMKADLFSEIVLLGSSLLILFSLLWIVRMLIMCA